MSISECSYSEARPCSENMSLCSPIHSTSMAFNLQIANEYIPFHLLLELKKLASVLIAVAGGNSRAEEDAEGQGR